MRNYLSMRSSTPADIAVAYTSARVKIAHLSAAANRKPRDSAKLPGGQSSSHVTSYPAFCCRSQSWRGWKYSSSGPASICRCPVITSIASGHGFEEPNTNVRLHSMQNAPTCSSGTPTKNSYANVHNTSGVFRGEWVVRSPPRSD